MRQLSLFTLLASIPLLFACQNDISESISAEDTLVYASALRGEAPRTPGTSQDEAPKPLRLCHLSDIRTAIAENPGLDSAAESSHSTKDKMHRSDEKKAQDVVAYEEILSALTEGKEYSCGQLRLTH